MNINCFIRSKYRFEIQFFTRHHLRLTIGSFEYLVSIKQ